jgi:hypothetical protein
MEYSAQNGSANPMTTLENHVDAELFQIFKPATHVKR